MIRKTAIAALVILSPLPAHAQVRAAAHESSPFQPNVMPTLEIRRAAGVIDLDGELDDAGWDGAARVSGFAEIQPGDGVRPPVETEALITYDESHLYVAFIAHGDPAGIRASLSDRDHAFGDDFVALLLDTYGDASWAYLLGANPLGVQLDERFTNNGEDASFDVVYETEGRITRTGYQVEFAIPFSSLRFPDRSEQTWRINLFRNYPRASRHQFVWAGLDQNDPCVLCQSGTLAGIQGVKPGGQLELLPAVVATQAASLSDPSDPASSFENGDINAAASLGVRYPFHAGWTAELAVNPDFSQVESDATQIDVNSTFALSYPERRPFFQEGSDLFRTWLSAVYTRSINDPVAASKLTGRMGRTSVAYIGARDEHSAVIVPFEEESAIHEVGESWSNIVRLRRNFSNDSYVGGLITDRRLDAGGSGSLAGADGLIRLGGPYQFEWQVLASHTAEPDAVELSGDMDGLTFDAGAHTAAFDGESYWGRAAYAALRRNARLWSFGVEYGEATPTFRADNGFQTRNDFRRIEIANGLAFHQIHRLVDVLDLGVEFSRGWNFAALQKDRSITPHVSFMLKSQTHFYFGYTFESERFHDVTFDGLGRWQVNFSSNFSEPVSLGFWMQRGDMIARTLDSPAVGRGTGVSAWATLKPTDRLEIRPAYSFEELRLPDGDMVYSGYIVRARVAYQFSRELFLRMVTQYNDFSGGLDLEPLLMYRLNPFSIVYLGSTHDWSDFEQSRGLTRTGRQFFLKVQYLFRR